MLSLTRLKGESILVDGPAVVTVGRIDGNKVRLLIEAEPDVRILRAELERRTESLDQQPEKRVG